MLKIRSVSKIALSIPSDLDNGEWEVIALALEIGEQRILLDEREARQVAQMRLQVIGTLGILLLAKNRKIITQVQPLLDAMMDTAQYWVSRTLYKQVLQQAGEFIE
ncbi:MAG: DUF3368 domain-containing protein [Rhizonema sp. PD37]|nr:DUF3368 domain-containing protein [Rhizonema sp. PD37]